MLSVAAGDPWMPQYRLDLEETTFLSPIYIYCLELVTHDAQKGTVINFLLIVGTKFCSVFKK